MVTLYTSIWEVPVSNAMKYVANLTKFYRDFLQFLQANCKKLVLRLNTNASFPIFSVLYTTLPFDVI
jgi:hypothetical protein